MVSLQELNAKIEEAKMKKDKESIDAQIEVYEGQSYEARQSYTEAKASRSKSRSKLPKDIPDDSAYKERLLEAQYIKAQIYTQEQSDQVDEYTAEIKKQQKAKENIQIFDKQIPQLYTSAVQEIETTKSAVTKAKEDVEVKYDAVIKTHKEEIVKEEKRIEDQSAVFDSVPSGGSWGDFIAGKETVYLGGGQGRRPSNRKDSRRRAIDQHFAQGTLPPTNIGNARGGNDTTNYTYLQMQSEYNLKIKTQNATINIQKAQKEYGFSMTAVPANAGRDVFKAINNPALYGIGTDARQMQHRKDIGANVKIGTANKNLREGMYSITEYQKIVGGAGAQKQAEAKLAQEARSRAYRVESRNQLSADSKKWASVVSNPYISNPDHQTPTNRSGSGTASDPFRYNTNAGGTGLESKEVDKSKLAYYMQNLQTSSNSLNNNTLKNTSFSNKGTDVTNQSLQQIAKQRETELANRQQQQYTQELRAGNIGLADALLNPQTTQSYTGTNTVNLKTFLKERGHDLSKPESIPDSVLMNPQKYVKAREVASESAKLNTTMGDLRFNEPIYSKATALVQQQREEAKQRIAKFDPIKDSQNMTSPQWVVTTTEKQNIPTMSGGVFQVDAPVENVFDTLKEAKAFDKSQKFAKSSSDYDNYSLANYSHAVRTGLVVDPSTTPQWQDDVALKFSQAFEPLSNIGKSVNNMVGGKEMVYTETAEEMLISGTINDIASGTPFKGTGVSGAWEEIVKDPSRFAVQLPATAVMYWTGGKVISYGTKVVGTGVSATAKLGTKIIQSNAPTIVKIPTIAMMGAGQTVKQIGTNISAIPSKIGSSVYTYGTVPRGTKYGMPVFTIPQQVVRQGIVNPYDKATLFQGSRVGFGTKMNFVISPSGKMFVRQATDIGSDIGAKPQFLNKQVAMFETDGVTGFATRGKIQTVEKTLPKEKLSGADVWESTGKTKLITKETPYSKPLDSITGIRIGKPDVQIPTFASPLKRPDIFDRLKHSVIGRSQKTEEVKTAIDKITFYSDTTGDALKGARPSKVGIQGEMDNFKVFDNPKITETRETLNTFKTSTSTPVIVKTKVFGDKVKLTQMKHKDTVATGTEVTGKENLKIVKELTEKGTLTEVGKKTVIKGTDYLAGGKKAGQLKQTLESRDATYYQTTTGKFKPKDETTLYTVSTKTIPVDKIAFSQTMKESNLLREIADKTPLNKKSTVPKGIDDPINDTSSSKPRIFEEPKIGKGDKIIDGKEGSIIQKTKLDIKPEVKLSPKTIHTPAQIQIPKIKATVKPPIVSPKIKQKITPKVTQTQKLDTGSVLVTKQDTGLSQITKQVSKMKIKTPTKQRTKLGIKSVTALKTAQMTMIKTSPILKITAPRRKPLPIVIPIPKPEIKKTRRGKRGKKAGFIGNVRTDNIMGMYKRSEITYGKKKVSKLERQDARLTAQTPNRISMSASGLLKTKTKGKKKSTSVFGTETKDEFAGFNTKGKKKKSKSKKTKSKKIRLM